MAFPNRLLSTPTWRTLGLGLATTILSLGIGALVKPLFLADTVGITPTTPEGRTMVEKMMVLLAARDLSIATALLWFYYEGKSREMGLVLTSGGFIWVLDLWITGQGPRGWDAGAWGLTGAATFGTVVGLGLLQS